MSALPNLPPGSGGPRSVIVTKRAPAWQRILLWTLALIAGVFVVLTVAVAVLLHSQRFHDYALAKARQSATESLGVPVELQNFALHFSGISPTLDLYGLVVHGAAPYANPPLLQAEQARIGVRVVSLVSRKWYLSEITIHHPVVQLRVDADGNTNLPKPKSTGSSSNGVQTLFDLAIRHAALDHGELYYNSRLSSLDADIRDLMLNAGFNPARNTYAGQLSYADGHLKSGSYEPIPHALSAEFEMTPTHLDLRNASLRSGATAIMLSATVDDFSNPRVNSSYHASLNATELRKLLHNPDLPLGVIDLDGHAEYAAKPNQPALNSATINGSLRSDRLEFITPSARTDARTIRATYSLSNGDAELRSLTASLLGGTLNGNATVRNLSGEQVGLAHLKLNGISLATLKQLASPATNNVTVAGTLQATSDASWKGSPNNLIATVDAAVNATAGSTASTNTVPIIGEIHGNFRNSDQQLTLRQSYLRTPQTSLTLDGTAGRNSQMKVALNATDLHELESVAAIFSKPSQPYGLYGSATFTGTLYGTTAPSTLAGALS